ncbi:MAG: prepilin peptidase [Clostridiales bacterium]|jgi:leader peptidase (prepilin peptidase)/N-methyltransferase|nr:prepilin peptidase [Clostridiales bacterium]
MPYYEVRLIILFGLLAWATVTDLKARVIPNKCTLTGMAASLALAAAEALTRLLSRDLYSGEPLADWALGLLAGGLPLYLVMVISRGGMGGGDVKLMAMVGAFAGYKNALAVLFLSVILGGAAAAALILFKKRGVKSLITFGPFIALATLIVVLFHDFIARFVAEFYFVDF